MLDLKVRRGGGGGGRMGQFGDSVTEDVIVKFSRVLGVGTQNRASSGFQNSNATMGPLERTSHTGKQARSGNE